MGLIRTKGNGRRTDLFGDSENPDSGGVNRHHDPQIEREGLFDLPADHFDIVRGILKRLSRDYQSTFGQMMGPIYLLSCAFIVIIND